jgi:hypothetical protein
VIARAGQAALGINIFVVPGLVLSTGYGLWHAVVILGRGPEPRTHQATK